MLKRELNSIAWPWPVDDFKDYAHVLNGFTHDVSFHGWVHQRSGARRRSVTRPQALRVLKETTSLACDIASYPNFTGHLEGSTEGLRRRIAYSESIQHSRLALCPETLSGVIPYRFYEALSCARVPVLVSSDYLLPLANWIPYDDFIVRCAVEEIPYLGVRLRTYLDRTPDAELMERGKLGQSYWREFLQREKWAETMTMAVAKKVEHY